MVRRLWGALSLLLWMLVLLLPTAAIDLHEVTPSIEEPLEAFYAALPDELREILPPDLDAGALPDADAVREAGGLSALFARVRGALVDALPDAGQLLGQIALCLLFAAMFGVICTAIDGGRIGDAAQLIGRLCTATLLLSAQLGQMELVTASLAQMRFLLNAMLPVIAAILAAGGNAGTAAAGSGSLMVFLGIGENLASGVFLPLIAASGGLAAVAWLPAGERLRGVSAAIARLTTWLMGLFGAVFSAVVAFQTVLAAGADNLAARTVKFAIGSTVPVIGNAVGDTVRTVGAALRYLRDTVGLLGILVLVLITIPPLVEVVLHRTVLRIGEGMAELLGCSAEQRLLGAFATTSGLLLALLCGALICFIFAVAVLIRVTLAAA